MNVDVTVSVNIQDLFKVLWEYVIQAYWITKYLKNYFI